MHNRAMLFHDVSLLPMSCFPGAVLEAPYTEAVDHRPPLPQMHELERTSLLIVVVVALLTKRVGNM